MKREFISYPKSGRSWLRYALTQLEIADQIDFHHDRFEFSNRTKPAHDFSLEDRITRYLEGSRIVYLERDPRDIMVSLYFQITGRFGPVFNFQGGFSEFIRDPYFGAENLLGFRQMWATLRKSDAVLTVTYEQCHKDFPLVLTRISQHYDCDLSRDRILQATDRASFENMKTVERSETFPKNWLRPRNGAPKMRKGVVGGYRDHLDEADIAYLEQLFNL